MADNLKTVYSPAGEKFEVTPANFRDLTRLAGWTETLPHPDTVAANSAPAEDEGDENADDNSDTNENDDANADDNSDNNENDDDNSDDENADNNDENTTPVVELKTQPHHFADMDKEAARAYIEDKFPGTELDGRWNRDKLVALAIELAAAA